MMQQRQTVGDVANHILNNGKVGNILQPSARHAFVLFNNQNSVLLSMYVLPGVWWFLHDNRIFGFKASDPPKMPPATDDVSEPSTDSQKWEDAVATKEDAVATKKDAAAAKEAAAGAKEAAAAAKEAAAAAKEAAAAAKEAAAAAEEAAAGAKEALQKNCQDFVLSLLTTPKFRFMSALFVSFRLIDDLSLILIIVLTVFNSDGGLVIPTWEQITLYSVFVLDIFNTVMNHTHLSWTLQRLSIYLGLLVFGVYGVAIHFYKLRGDYDQQNELEIVIIVFLVRLLAFALEASVDIAIDLELHNDLWRMELVRRDGLSAPLELRPFGAGSSTGDGEKQMLIPDNNPEQNSICKWPASCRAYLTNTGKFELPPGVRYVGSLSAWLSTSVYTQTRRGDTADQSTFSPWATGLLCLLPGLVAILPMIALLGLCLTAVLCRSCASCLFNVCCGCGCFVQTPGNCHTSSIPGNRDYWNEMFFPESSNTLDEARKEHRSGNQNV